MRADARRNRDRVLDAADSVFSERGTTASTEEIARQTGVGIGTVFRHFPTKETLLEAVLVRRLERVADHAESLAAGEEPGAAFIGFLTRTVEQSRGKTAIADALASSGIGVDQAASVVRDRLRNALSTLLRRAQQDEAVRRDIGVTEVISLLVGISRASEYANWDPGVQARVLAVVLDGLRPS